MGKTSDRTSHKKDWLKKWWINVVVPELLDSVLSQTLSEAVLYVIKL